LLTFKHYYAMKKTMIITGAISVITFVFGSIFKIMHWPGASILLVLGIGFTSVLFLPLLFILKTRDQSNAREKLIVGVGALIGILLCLATLFTVMHWGAGNGVLWLTAIGLSVFVLIPVYFFTGIRNPESKANTIITSIVLFGASGLLFSMINLRPSLRTTELKMSAYVQSEDLLSRMQKKVSFSPSAQKVNGLCAQLKSMIIHNETDLDEIPSDFKKQNVLMEEHNLGTAFFGQEAGVKLANELREAITKYNAEVASEKKIPLENSILAGETQKLGSYSNYVVLNSINQVQMYLAEGY
ncbi:MAG TPA: hypothetical protein VI112_14600, partial [Bacteroidia bacterium]